MDNDFDFPDDWEPTPEQLQSLAMEKSLRPSETHTQTAERIFEEASPAAAQEIVRLATNRQGNERIRLDAAKYVIERSLGKLGDNTKPAAQNPWDDVYGAMVSEAETHANTPKS